jgi:hypothetical protein
MDEDYYEIEKKNRGVKSRFYSTNINWKYIK